MRFIALLIAGLLALCCNLARAQDISSIEFDARDLDRSEIRIVQAALAFSGDYVGLLDGAWGQGSQRSLEAYSSRTSGAAKPRFADLRPLLLAFETEWTKNGWSVIYSETTNTSYVHPFGLLHKSGSKDSLSFRTEDDRLNVVVDFESLDGALAIHKYFLGKANPLPEPYQTLKPERLITSVGLRGDLLAYVRSDLSDGIYVTLSIIAAPEYRTRLALMASSIQRGKGDDLTIPNGGFLDALLQTQESTPAIAAENSGSGATTNSKSSFTSTGTGFFVNNTDIVTANHVIQDCARVSLADGSTLSIVASDKKLDLAVLTSTSRSPSWLSLSPAMVPRLGEQVTALGFPYLGTLAQGLTVTGGNVSAMQGIDGRKDEVMVSAPVQPGNSGGPLLNSVGAVVGVVVARVNDIVLLKETGTLPQNMNFAVPNGPLTAFLQTAGVLFPVSEQAGIDLSGGIPDALLAAVVPVLCYQ